ncbi:alpha/beta hydrolase domain-containing protein [Dietzia sp. SYD-A1]|uniref:alpha/beta hydrolase domain-containing protein n=1 Tax=Dietzia sp. SYD-A1 TaxID=2780141 RepID=UPI001E64D8D2|nr:alpha/beta hydrolase domain-containing protein [Dietzia sp. SYD-A1]
MERSPRATFAELTQGKAFPPMSGRAAPDLAAAGFGESEWACRGEAVSYAPVSTPRDGRFELTEADSAPFATRVLVRRPRPDSFSGVVLVEWLNVSGGQDAAPDYTYLAEEILRAGHAWVGVSAQFIAVEGGDAAVGLGGRTAGLRTQRAERYADLHHPGDAYAYDIVTQVGRHAREPDADGPLAGLRARSVIAVGESQSAFALTSYVNGVHPRAGVFDGFLLHSRGAGYLPFDDRGRGSDIVAALGRGPATIREDVDVPVMVVQAEGDLMGRIASLPARQPDSRSVMSWEIAGQAHADLYQLGDFAQFVDCRGPVNSGQQVFVLRAALRHLVSWVAGGARPPAAPPVETDDGEVVPDEFGTGRGGVRTPVVEAPVEHLTGVPHPEAQPLCMLLGRTVELPDEVLRERWPGGGRAGGTQTGREQYLAAYRAATDRLIEEGFLLPEDREEVLADARPERITW